MCWWPYLFPCEVLDERHVGGVDHRHLKQADMTNKAPSFAPLVYEQ